MPTVVCIISTTLMSVHDLEVRIEDFGQEQSQFFNFKMLTLTVNTPKLFLIINNESFRLIGFTISSFCSIVILNVCLIIVLGSVHICVFIYIANHDAVPDPSHYRSPTALTEPY